MAARYKERLGERIKTAREEAGLSQTKLARTMPGSLDGASISRWESGRVEPRAENLEALAAALGKDVSYFLAPAPTPGTGDLMGALAGETQLDRVERKLDVLLQRVGERIVLADLTEEITRYFEDRLGKTPAPGPAARDTSELSDARSATARAPVQGKRRIA